MLTGREVHRAFMATYPYLEPDWSKLKPCSQAGYDKVASELNKTLAEDVVTINAVRCNECKEMLEAEHAEGHACWLKGGTIV